MFIVIREHGKSRDYLTSLNTPVWGTTSTGNKGAAIRFPSASAARAAARKARRACMGWNGEHPVRAQGIVFRSAQD